MGENPHNLPPDRRSGEPFIRQVRIRNYKSLGKCDIQLRPLTILAGRNGAGKSNFLDSLRFVAESLQSSLDHAMRSRGGIDSVRRRSTGHPRNFAIELKMALWTWREATYGFEIGARPRGGFAVKWEWLRIHKPNGDLLADYSVSEGKVTPSDRDMPPASADRLYLVNAAGLPDFREVYDQLTSMGFYNLNPDTMKALQSPDAGELLRRDGSNIASVVARLSSERPQIKDRIKSYLGEIVPGVTDMDRASLGPRETLEFRQEITGSDHPWKFYAASMSDGTLRALGTLVAVAQLADQTHPASLIGIEEPETALHPAAAGALMDSLKEAATHTQILLTTHSPDLLDQIDPASTELLVAQATRGTTEIARVDPASLDSIQSHLYTAGELLRMDQLQPDPEDLRRQEQLVFDFGSEETS
jgi:predicted ATPase